MKLVAQFNLPEKARRVADQLAFDEWLATDVKVDPGSRSQRATVTWTADVRRHNSRKGAQQDYFDLATRLCGYYGSSSRYRVRLRAELPPREGETEPLVWERDCPYIP
jgi:hypothetical protein